MKETTSEKISIRQVLEHFKKASVELPVDLEDLDPVMDWTVHMKREGTILYIIIEPPDEQ